MDAMTHLPQRAERENRAALYRTLGITLRYERTTAGVERVHARLSLSTTESQKCRSRGPDSRLTTTDHGASCVEDPATFEFGRMS